MANLRSWSGYLRAAVLGLPLLLTGAGPAQPHAPTLDGHLDAAYVLLATDPTPDLAATFTAAPQTNWAELSALYVLTDTTNLYVYVPLPNYSSATAEGEVGLAIDTTGDVANSGGAVDRYSSGLTFAYTVTHANTGTVPLDTANVILPDVLIRGNVVGSGGGALSGLTHFWRWDEEAWVEVGSNWGGITIGGFVGTHIAYASGYGVEFSIPFADLQVPPEAPLHLQFFTISHIAFTQVGTYDTVPADDQITDANDTTTQHRLASLLPAVLPGPCASAALGDHAVVAAGLAHDSTQIAYRDPLGDLLPGAAATLSLRVCLADLQSVDLLVWDTADPLAETPSQTVPLTAATGAVYDVWEGTVAAPAGGGDQWYLFRLNDGGAPSYFRALTTSPGPGQWSASLQSPSWSLPTLPGQALYLPQVVRP